MADFNSLFLFSMCILLALDGASSNTLMTVTFQQGVNEVKVACERSTTNDWDVATSEAKINRRFENETVFSELFRTRFPQPNFAINPTTIWTDKELEKRAEVTILASPLPKAVLTIKNVSCPDQGYYQCQITATSNDKSPTREFSDDRCEASRGIYSPMLLLYIMPIILCQGLI